MAAWLRTVYGLVLAAWVGATAYFSAVLAPTLGDRFPDSFGTIVQALFPGYFALGEALTGVAAAAALVESRLLPPPPGRGAARTRLLLAVIALGLAAYNGEVLLPAVHAARDDPARFLSLHARSLLVNTATALLALAGAWIAHSRPRSTGRAGG